MLFESRLNYLHSSIYICDKIASTRLTYLHCWPIDRLDMTKSDAMLMKGFNYSVEKQDGVRQVVKHKISNPNHLQCDLRALSG